DDRLAGDSGDVEGGGADDAGAVSAPTSRNSPPGAPPVRPPRLKQAWTSALAEIEERLARDGGDFVLKRRSASGPPVQHLRTGVLGQACSTRSIPGDALDLLHGHPPGGVQAVIFASAASTRSSAGMLSARSGSVPPRRRGGGKPKMIIAGARGGSGRGRGS